MLSFVMKKAALHLNIICYGLIKEGFWRFKSKKIPSCRSQPGPGSLPTYCTYLPPVRLTDLIYGQKTYPPEQRREEDGVVCQNDSLRLV